MYIMYYFFAENFELYSNKSVCWAVSHEATDQKTWSFRDPALGYRHVSCPLRTQMCWTVS